MMSSPVWIDIANAFLELEPAYLPWSKEVYPTDWAMWVFGTIGVLLALFVPTVAEFERHLTEELGEPLEKNGWHATLYRRYCGRSLAWQGLFNLLKAEQYYIILCILQAVFVFIPNLRGVSTLLTFWYSGWVLRSMQALSNIESCKALVDVVELDEASLKKS